MIDFSDYKVLQPLTAALGSPPPYRHRKKDGARYYSLFFLVERIFELSDPCPSRRNKLFRSLVNRKKYRLELNDERLCSFYAYRLLRLFKKFIMNSDVFCHSPEIWDNRVKTQLKEECY